MNTQADEVCGMRVPEVMETGLRHWGFVLFATLHINALAHTNVECLGTACSTAMATFGMLMVLRLACDLGPFSTLRPSVARVCAETMLTVFRLKSTCCQVRAATSSRLSPPYRARWTAAAKLPICGGAFFDRRRFNRDAAASSVTSSSFRMTWARFFVLGRGAFAMG